MKPGRGGILGLAAVGVLSCGTLIAPELAHAAIARFKAQPASSAPLRVLTFNVWDQNIAPDETAEAIIATNPDVVAIQEVNGLWGPPIERLKDTFGYFGGWTDDCDIELLSKRPLTDFNKQTRPINGHPFSILSAHTTAPDGTAFEIVTTHYAWPVPPGTQIDERPLLADFLRDQDLRNLVFTGDFNLNPWSEALRGQDAALRPLSTAHSGAVHLAGQYCGVRSAFAVP